MTEYELVDAMANFQSNLIQGQALTISMLTAYMVVAYTVGSKLTTFQCVFASILFLIFGILGVTGQFYNLNEMYRYGAELGQLRENVLGETSSGEVGEAARWIFIIVRMLMLLGALYFMWRVRHPASD